MNRCNGKFCPTPIDDTHNGLFLEFMCRLFLWCLFMYTEYLEPFIRHIEEEELWMYRYPVVKSFVPMKYLWHIIVLIPAIVLIIEFIIFHENEKKLRNVKNDIAGFTLAYPLSGIFTNSLKNLIGRPRPNFFFRCFPDGVGTNLVNCTGDNFLDGRKSFPSGHSSFAFTSMWYLTLNLIRELNPQKPGPAKSIKLVVCLLPTCFSTIVAVSRTCDYNHHFTDIIGGALLGIAVSSLVYWVYQDENDTAVNA